MLASLAAPRAFSSPEPLLDIDRSVADFLLSDPALLLDRPAGEWESALALCADMGWSEREYALRSARYAARGGAPSYGKGTDEVLRLARLAVRTGKTADAARYYDDVTTVSAERLAERGNALLRAGRKEEGVRLLRRAIDEGAPDADLLRYRVAVAVSSEKRGDAAILGLLDLAAGKSRYATASLHAAAEILFREGEKERGEALLSRAYGTEYEKLSHRGLLYSLAVYAAEKGDSKSAAKLYGRILHRWPADRRALDSFRALRRLEESGRIPRDDRLALAGARAARQNGRTEEAIQLLKPYLDRSTGDPLYAEAVLEMGRVSYGADRFTSALGYFGRLTDAGSALARSALLYTARSYRKMGEWRKAIDAYSRYVERFPGSDIAPEVQWEISWRWKILGEYRRAAESFGELKRAFPSSSYGGRAVLQEALCLDLAGDTAKAAAILEKMLRVGGGGRDRDDALFWLGDMSERLGREERMMSAYRELTEEYPETYYGLRAAGRIGVTVIRSPGDANVADRDYDPLLRLVRRWPASGRTAVPRSWDLLRYYVDIGEGTAARREAARLVKAHRKDAEGLVELARLCRRLGLADYTIRCGRALQDLAAGAGADDVDPFLLMLIYPAGYLDLVVAETRRYDDVDPFFILGLMRQESWFRADARSSAGARGLLQIIPPTGKHIAREMGDGDSFRVDMLLDPEKNIRYGVWYVRSLQRRYGGRLPVVASAYNAGETNADLWTERNDRFPAEEFVEGINYSETRTYVKRTLSGYWIYRSLYRDLATRLLAL